MKVSGFTIIRNGNKYDFPYLEAIKSIAPLCDEIIVAVGNSDDGTRASVLSLNEPKIKIIDTIWDESLREGGVVLAVETDKAFDAIAADSDWCFYVQGDEVFHEQDYEKIQSAMVKNLHNSEVEGIVFRYRNLYGSYDYEADNHNWLKNEVRIVRNNPAIRSWKDAMSFRKNGKKLHCKMIDASIYHYGWVKNPVTQQLKRKNFEKLWHDDDHIEQKMSNLTATEFDYSKIESLRRFHGTHPAVMQPRIAQQNWQFDYDPTTRHLHTKFRHRIVNWLEKVTGLEIMRFKNYVLIK